MSQNQLGKLYNLNGELHRIKQHRYGQMIPHMKAKQRETLKRSLAVIGQQLPIVLYQDEVLDGWERLNLIRELRREKKFKYKGDDGNEVVVDTSDLEPVVSDFRGNDEEAILFVAAMIERKNIDNDNRVAIALKIKNELAGLKSNNSVEAAAEASGLSERTVARAAKVEKEADPEVTRKMKEGKISVHAAEKTLTKSKEDHLRDDSGKVVPKGLREVFADAPIIEGMDLELGRIIKSCSKIVHGPNKSMITQSLVRNLTSCKDVFTSERPAYVCQTCSGDGKFDGKNCKKCRGDGFLRYGNGTKPKFD